MKQRITSTLIIACIALIINACNKCDVDYEALTSEEVKVVIDGGGKSITCPYCGKDVMPGKYHHHTAPKAEKCPVDSCEFNGKDHRHCYFNGQGACPGHERGHGGMGGGSWNTL